MNKKLAVLLLISSCGNALGGTWHAVKDDLRSMSGKKGAQAATDQGLQWLIRTQLGTLVEEHNITTQIAPFVVAALAGGCSSIMRQTQNADFDRSLPSNAQKGNQNLVDHQGAKATLSDMCGATTGEAVVKGTSVVWRWCVDKLGVSKPSWLKGTVGSAVCAATTATAEATVRAVTQTATVALIKELTKSSKTS